MAEIGVGIVGFGLATKVFHAPFVSAVPGLKLKAIVQRTGEEAARAYLSATVYRNLDEMLRDPAVQLVVVATPNETHFALARQALSTGRHVVIDKPFAATSAEATELIDLAQAKGLVLAPFHNRRWDGDFVTVKKILAEGRLGRVVTVESHFDRFRPIPRQGTWKETSNPANGLLFDLGPHLVDQAVALYGVPETIHASVRTDRDHGAIEDAFDLCLGFRLAGGQGLRYWCRSSMIACDNAPRFLLHGTRGSFKKYGLDPQEPALVGGAKVPRMGEGEWLQEAEEHFGTLTIAPVPAEPGTLMPSKVRTELGDYRLYYANVRDAIQSGSKLAVTPEEGFTVIRLLELARVSSGEGRTVVV